jgi:alkanesulfonate monooxygenase SsuD/methylene tetrahydromethanopterin reductase-like flavin-dependent oxidoreductase (luciferase family)
MKFGVFHMTHAPVGGDHGDVYRTFLDLAVEADKLGFWSLWTTEHHFVSDPAYTPFGDVSADYEPQAEYDITPDPFALLAYTAAVTTRLRLGTAVAVLPWDHPVRVAERASMLDVLSGGRMELGVGRGSDTRETPVFGVPRDPAAALRRFQEAIHVVRKAWGGRPFSHEGEFYEVPPGLAITPTAIQPEAPLWLGSASDDSARWAAEQGLPYATIAWPLMLMEAYEAKATIYQEAADAAEVDVSGNDNVVLLYTYCGESDEEAAATAYPHMRMFQYINEQHYEMFRDPDRARAIFDATGKASAEQWVHDNARYTVEHHLVGSADTIVERLKAHERDFGLRYVLMNHGWGLMDHDASIASMRRIAEKVMPHFAAQRP